MGEASKTRRAVNEGTKCPALAVLPIRVRRQCLFGVAYVATLWALDGPFALGCCVCGGPCRLFVQAWVGKNEAGATFECGGVIRGKVQQSGKGKREIWGDRLVLSDPF